MSAFISQISFLSSVFYLCLAGIIGIGSILFVLLRERHLLTRLQDMLDSAIDGSFEEKYLNESRLSALESSMWRYLQGNQISYQKLAEKKQQVQEMISDISHQAVTPLSNILLYTQLLEEQAAESAEIPQLLHESTEGIQAIKEQAEKLDFFMQALVRVSRLESGIISIQPKEQDIRSVLSALRHQFLPRAALKCIQLTICEASSLALFDLKWTIEAIANLVDNAIKYTYDGGMVSVQITEYLMFLRIDVIDTGIGIPEQELGSIFTRFYRSPVVSDQPGVGLGLYLSREIINAQNGYIKVTSTPASGSTFSVFLLRKTSPAKISQN